MQRIIPSAAFRIALLTAAIAVGTTTAFSQAYRPAPESVITPDRMETRIGALEFKDGAPSLPTVQRVYDHLDFMRALNVYTNGFQGASMYAIRDGYRTLGLRDNQILLFSELMDSNSLFLTGDADSVLFLSFLDLTRGPTVFEPPPKSVGTINDMWGRWVIDFGVLGPDRGEGGKYLIVPFDYEGPLPEGGYCTVRARTYRVCMIGHAFMEKSDPKPTVALVKKTAKVYRYEQGGLGSSAAQFLSGKSKFEPVVSAPPAVFVEGSARSINATPPTNADFFITIRALVEQEPMESLGPDFIGNLAAIGIVKRQAFRPNARMKKILADAAAVGDATARSVFWNPREAEGFAYYPGSAWMAPLWVAGYDFVNPPPLISVLGAKPAPSNGGLMFDAKLSYYFTTVGISPTTCMRMTGVGSQCLAATLDVNKNYLDGGKTYKLNLPKDIPQAKGWSVTVYDNQTRSMLQTSQRYPMLGSQSHPRPAPNPGLNGSIDVYFGPKAPPNVENNWIQTTPDKGWFVILRLYGPSEPFFKKTWRPSEIELVK